MALKYTYDITNMTTTIWNSMSATAKQAYIKKFVDDLIKNEGTNADFWISAGFPQGAVITKVSQYYTGFDIRLYYSPTLFVSMFNIYTSSSGAPCWLKTATNIQLIFTEFAYSFTTPTKSLEIPKPDVAVTKYIQFMDKTSLYNSYVKNVNAELVKKQSVQVITDFIFGIFKNLTDGMVIYDYYQWQGEDSTGNYQLRMYKKMYLRVFGYSARKLVCKSILIDHNLFSGISGATLFDNGILIANDGITEKVGSGINSYQRKGYIIHANNCNLETFIQKLQEDSAYQLGVLEFPDYDSLQEKIEENKAFLTKDGKTAQQVYDDKYKERYAYFQRFKDILGLTDADCAAYATESATAYTNDYIKTLNDTIATEATVQGGMIAEQEYQQSQANQTVENAKAEAEAQKEADAKAEELEIAKVRSKEVKQKVIEYSDKLLKTYNTYAKTPKTKLNLGLPGTISEMSNVMLMSYKYTLPVSEVK